MERTLLDDKKMTAPHTGLAVDYRIRWMCCHKFRRLPRSCPLLGSVPISARHETGTFRRGRIKKKPPHQYTHVAEMSEFSWSPMFSQAYNYSHASRRPSGPVGLVQSSSNASSAEHDQRQHSTSLMAGNTCGLLMAERATSPSLSPQR